jgi:hypothetical protein
MDIFAKLFNINDSKTAILGGTIIDTDLRSGYDKEKMLPSKRNGSMLPNLGLLLYPGAMQLQEDFGKGSFSTSLMSTWINGFIPNNKGYAAATNVSPDVKELLDKLSIVKTEQISHTKKDLHMETLLSFLSFYGKSEAMLECDEVSADNKSALINKGLVCENWGKNPVPIRYVVRRKGDKSNPDYVYFIGGSNELLADKPSDLIETIKELYLTNVHENEALWNMDKRVCGLWEKNDDLKAKYDKLDATDLAKMSKVFTFLRTITGVIFIRNYLHYAYNYLGIETLNEFNGGGEKVKEKQTKKILDNYEEVYQYTKTITRLLYISKKDLSSIV